MDPKSVSLIICTKNRAVKLKSCFEHLEKLIVPKIQFEIIIVDNNSNDKTENIIHEYKKKSKRKIKYIKCFENGLGCARNTGVKLSLSEWIIFTDDDCYIDKRYLEHFTRCIERNDFQYGSGQILRYDQEDDPRIAQLVIKKKKIFPAYDIFLKPGTIQGANMFFKADIFKKAGLFNPYMGSGTSFACEDIEMAARASLWGFSGALIPELIVFHHHGRKLNSEEAHSTLKAYASGRGAYYASLLVLGYSDPWIIWSNLACGQISNPEEKRIYMNELEGALNYLKYYDENKDKLTQHILMPTKRRNVLSLFLKRNLYLAKKKISNFIREKKLLN